MTTAVPKKVRYCFTYKCVWWQSSCSRHSLRWCCNPIQYVYPPSVQIQISFKGFFVDCSSTL